MDQFLEELPKDQIVILRNQMNRFQTLQGRTRKQIIPKSIPILPEGTLIHGTSFNEKKLKSIAESGIITGQYFGIEEDGETYYCADFHRVKKEETLEEYNEWFPYRDGRCPFGTRGKNTVAFIIHPDPEREELCKYDCYRESTNESEATREFVNINGLPVEDREIASSILFGIPSSFINGVVVGDNLINEKNIQLLRSLFPNCYFVRNNGTIIYKQNDSEETAHLRIQMIQETLEREKTQEELRRMTETKESIQKDQNRMWEAIAHLPLEQIAKVYEQIGWQGDTLEFARDLKRKYNIKGGMSI